MTTPGRIVEDIENWDLVLSDARVAKIESKLQKKYPGLDKTDFVTMVQPAKLLTDYEPPQELPEMAVFAIVGPNPRFKDQRLMAYAVSSLQDFKEAESEFKHFVGIPDPAEGIFGHVAREWLKMYRNLKDMD